MDASHEQGPDVRLNPESRLNGQKNFTLLFEQSRDAVVLLDAEARFVDINPAAEKLLGYTRQEVHAVDYHSLFPEQTKLTEFNRILVRDGTIDRFELTAVDKQGVMKECEVSAAKIEDESGRLLGYQAIIRDVTRENRMKSELALAENKLKERNRTLMKLSAAILTAQERERKKISRELHDDIGQAMTAIDLSLQVLRQRHAGDKDIQSNVEYCQQIAHHAARKIQDFSRELRSHILEDHGLIPALQSQAQEFQRRTGVKVELDLRVDSALLEEALQLNLYRIVQEALNNVARHASADRVRIRLFSQHGQVKLEIEDNGRGFDLRKLDRTHPAGLGIMGMEERAILFGGHFHIDTVPGAGTRLQIHIPF
ncbi:MAG: PAS domain S-box protein [Candidatus Neomarinimicrobiota bacterium]|nr:MAG: PAS domain S-box protein [Candidatus Neomarinimicrobiota bacterium]